MPFKDCGNMQDKIQDMHKNVSKFRINKSMSVLIGVQFILYNPLLNVDPYLSWDCTPNFPMIISLKPIDLAKDPSLKL